MQQGRKTFQQLVDGGIGRTSDNPGASAFISLCSFISSDSAHIRLGALVNFSKWLLNNKSRGGADTGIIQIKRLRTAL
jgi:hypothetical protein